MNLTDEQKEQVRGWVAEGLKLADIQKKMEAELGLRPTYLDVRLLVDDLKVVPKDQEPPKQSTLTGPPGPSKDAPSQRPPVPEPEEEPFPTAGGVSVTVDAVARPGAVVSGGVRFSDGQSASWYLDQLGRLGLAPQQQGYRPSPEDLQSFQVELQNQLQRYGY